MSVNLRVSCVFFFFFFSLFSLFIYFWLCWVFVAARRLSLVAASGGHTLLRCGGFSCCRARALGAWASVLAACRLSSCGTWALGLVGFSSCGSRAQLLRGMWDLPWTRARTHVPCIGRRILNHCATREVPGFLLKHGTLKALQLWAGLCCLCPLETLDVRVVHPIPCSGPASPTSVFPPAQRLSIYSLQNMHLPSSTVVQGGEGTCLHRVGEGSGGLTAP